MSVNNNTYQSPLSTRYGSKYMQELFSSQHRYVIFRKLWLSLAKAEQKLGLPISEEQIKDLGSHLTDIDFEVVKAKEKEIRHDVMAHIYAYGEVAKSAKGIIHLGATSCYVTDNADLIIYRDAMLYIKGLLLGVMKNLVDFMDKTKAIPTLGYTHYQPAQLVTVGKRASLWLQDFMTDLDEVNFCLSEIKFLGCRGTTGTEASFVDLFKDENKVDKMNEMIAHDFGFNECFDVCGQTYPRKLDSRILHTLSSIGESAHKMATDVRLLQHDRQLEEPFEEKQVGSSAMAYKRNPMRMERICSLAKYLMTDSLNASFTSSTQWLERTLDDSAIRRLDLPEGFLACDAILHLLQNVTDGLVVNEKIINKAVMDYLPFIATENIMMEAVKKGADRQEVHEIIRSTSMEETRKMKNGEPWNLLEELAKRPELFLSKDELLSLMDPKLYIGRSVTQVERLIKKVKPLFKDAIIEANTIEL